MHKRVTGLFDRVGYDVVIKNVGKDEVNHDMVDPQAIQQYLAAVRMIFDIQS